MVWQDIAIAGATVLIIISLLYQVFFDFKHKVGSMTLPSAGAYIVALAIITFALFTLELYISTVLMGLNTSLWVVLFFQRVKYGK